MLLRLSVATVNTTWVPGRIGGGNGSPRNYCTKAGFTSHQLKRIEILC
jgi:hypothetical protein